VIYKGLMAVTGVEDIWTELKFQIRWSTTLLKSLHSPSGKAASLSPVTRLTHQPKRSSAVGLTPLCGSPRGAESETL